MCFLFSSHSMMQVTWMNFIDPVQEQGEISSYPSSSSDRHILQIGFSLACYSYAIFYNFSLILSSFPDSSKSIGLLSKPANSLLRFTDNWPRVSISDSWFWWLSMVVTIDRKCLLGASSIVAERFATGSESFDPSLVSYTTSFLIWNLTRPNLTVSPCWSVN